MEKTPRVLNWNLCSWTDVREKMRVLSYQGENMTATLTEVVPGHVPGPHSHVFEQLVMILQGECDFYVDGNPYHLTPGCIMSIPGGVEHYIVATGTIPVLNLDVFYPNRPERGESIPAENQENAAQIELFCANN